MQAVAVAVAAAELGLERYLAWKVVLVSAVLACSVCTSLRKVAISPGNTVRVREQRKDVEELLQGG